DAPKCPNIRALVQRLAANLLRAHVCRRAEDPSLVCRFSAERRQFGQVQPRSFGRIDLGQTKVQHFDSAFVRQLDVSGLDVSVDYFDRDVAAESSVCGAIEFSRAAGTQERKNFVCSDLTSQERFRRLHVSIAADCSTRGKKLGGQTPNFTQGQGV